GSCRSDSMRRALRALCLAGTPLFMSACADFDEQVVYLYFDKDADELSLLVLYQGVHHEGEEAKSQGQIDRFVPDAPRPAHWEVAFGDNWIGHITKDDLDQIARDPSVTPPGRDAAAAFAENIEVANGRFYRDGENRLCGFQRITLRKASRCVLALNRVLSEALPSAAREMTKPFTLNERSLEGFDRAAR